MKKQQKNSNKGITLIALVITIIVLLILVAVVINMLTGENGVLAKARWSEAVSEYGKVDELEKLFVIKNKMNQYGETEKNKPKISLKSLFTNISYASETVDTIYPINPNEKVDVMLYATSLHRTICYEENLTTGDLTDERFVNLYKVDFSLLEDSEVKREYVINIVSGMLYWLEPVHYQGLDYHTPRYGVKEENEPIEEGRLLIHYKSGYSGGDEYTQEVQINQASSVTLDDLSKMNFAKTGHNFLHWKDVTVRSNISDGDDEKKSEDEFKKREDGYYGVINQLSSILGDDNWEKIILEYIEENKEDMEQTDDESRADAARRQTISRIEGYLKEGDTAESDINHLLLESGIEGASITNLATWLLSGQEVIEYLTDLPGYEETDIGDGNNEQEENQLQVITYDNGETNVDMRGEDLILEAEWINTATDTATITYNAGNGGIIKGTTSKIKREKKVVSEQLGELPIAVVQGVEFKQAWYDAEIGGNKVDKTTPVTGNMTLYCQWSKVELCYPKGGILDNSYKEGSVDKTVNYPQWNPVRDNAVYVADGQKIGMQYDYPKKGYYQLPLWKNDRHRPYRFIYKNIEGFYKPFNVSFLGWYTAPDGQGTKVSYNTTWNNQYVTAGQQPKLYAFWKYLVIYDANEGEWNKKINNQWSKVNKEPMQAVKGGKYPNIKQPTRSGYTFVGWYDAKVGGNKIELRNSAYTVEEDNKILYAHWEPVEFEVDIPLSTIANTEWTQSVKATSGNISGYTIKYYISEDGPTDKDAEMEPTNKAKNKSDLTTYYVWATATKGDITIKSKNYVEVYTGHQHIGKSSVSGDCYTKEIACPQNQKYIYTFTDKQEFYEWTGTKTYYCTLCGNAAKWCSKTNKINNTVECSECGAYWTHTNDTYHELVCENCWENKRIEFKTIVENNVTKYVYKFHHGVVNGNRYTILSYNTILSPTKYYVAHKKSYELTCKAKDFENGVPRKVNPNNYF